MSYQPAERPGGVVRISRRPGAPPTPYALPNGTDNDCRSAVDRAAVRIRGRDGRHNRDRVAVDRHRDRRVDDGDASRHVDAADVVMPSPVIVAVTVTTPPMTSPSKNMLAQPSRLAAT